MVRLRDRDPRRSDILHDSLAFGGNMGCNMAFRFSALRNVRFDERLPLYAWLEDHDFRGQVERRGASCARMRCGVFTSDTRRVASPA